MRMLTFTTSLFKSRTTKYKQLSESKQLFLVVRLLFSFSLSYMADFQSNYPLSVYPFRIFYPQIFKRSQLNCLVSTLASHGLVVCMTNWIRLIWWMDVLSCGFQWCLWYISISLSLWQRGINAFLRLVKYWGLKLQADYHATSGLCLEGRGGLATARNLMQPPLPPGKPLCDSMSNKGATVW